ncbi:chaperone [Mycoemilia scoparia]|uniref:Chaperone n=1 Tax=Mycoemilia scoparia TaxID=417184 RepID=A0A9W7ZPT4_9FUNG|nr:chaperone [Mycoemilia scoparia]
MCMAWGFFYTVKIDGYAVLLDKRYLKTPGGKSLRVPLEQSTLAYLIAGEWETQKDALKTHSLPLTSMVCRAQDGLTNPEDREKVVDHLLRYFKTDSICLQEDFPEALVKLQNEHWKPIIDWASKAFGIKISTTTDILGMKQPEESAKVLKDVVLAFTPTELAAFEKAVMSSKSFLIALAIIKRRITSEDAAVAARVEALSQIQYWGELINAHDMDEAEMNKHLAASACLVSKF